jgi:hypothetical protein
MNSEAASIAVFKETQCYKQMLDVVTAFDNDQMGNVAAKDRIVKHAFDNGWGRDMDYHCKEMGALRENRDFEGCTWQRAHSRLQVIKNGGCSIPTLRASLLVREENPYRKDSAKYTAGLQHKALQFAKYQEYEIKAGCYGATHCVHGFACAHDQVQSQCEALATLGKLDPTKIIGNDTALRHCIYEKIKVKQLRWEIHAALPQTTKIIVSALNTVMQVGEGESWMQNLRKLAEEASAYKGKVDMVACQKNVLKSQPPRAADVPAMGKYLVAWGGLPSGVHVNELCDSLSYFMPTGRIVSGTFFDAMAQLRFPVDFIPSHLVNAFLFTHAAKDHGVQDNIARYITKPDLFQLQNVKKAQLLKDAENCLQRGKKLIQTHASLISISIQHELFGNYKIDVVELVSEKYKQQEKYTKKGGSAEPPTLTKITQNFVSKVMKAAGVVVRTEPDEAAPKASKEDADTATNVVTYDDDGIARGVGKTTLLNKGFLEKMNVKEKFEEGLNQFMITDIGEDGSVTIVKVNVDGEPEAPEISPPQRIALNAFLDKYKPCREIQYLKNYPAIDCMHDSAHKVVEYKCMVMQALGVLMAKFKSPAVRIMTSPSSGVYASKHCSIGAYVAIPMVNDLIKLHVETDRKKDAPPKAITVTFSEKGAPRVLIYSQPPSEKFVAQFWSIGDTSDKKEVNVVFVEKVVKTRRPSLGDKNSNEVIEVTIPVLVNTKDIEANQEIFLYKAKKAKVDAPEKRVMPELQPKRPSKSSKIVHE